MGFTSKCWWNPYIESSSINVLELEVKKENGLIEVLYAFDAVILSYENSKKEKRTATTHSAEFGRALFAFWGKCIVETFFEKELKVNTRYIDLTYFKVPDMRKVTV